MRTHVRRDRYGLLSTVELREGERTVAMTTCFPGVENERRAAARLKAGHRHRKFKEQTDG